MSEFDVVLNEYEKRFSSVITEDELMENAVLLDTNEIEDGDTHKIIAYYFIKRLDNKRFDYFVFSEISDCKTDNQGNIENIYATHYLIV